MCAIFGYAGGTIERRVDKGRLLTMAVAAQERGPHAWGCAWLDAGGRMGMHKQPGKITDSLDVLAGCAREAVMMVCHVRWATHGDPSDNATNHPHACGDGWLVHNGQVEFADCLRDDFALEPKSDCDSELIAILADTLVQRTAAARLASAVQAAQAYGKHKPAHAVAALHARPRRLLLARAGKPLHVQAAAGGLWWGTVPVGHGFRPMPNGSCCQLTYRKGELKASMFDDAIDCANATDGNLLY